MRSFSNLNTIILGNVNHVGAVLSQSAYRWSFPRFLKIGNDEGLMRKKWHIQVEPPISLYIN